MIRIKHTQLRSTLLFLTSLRFIFDQSISTNSMSVISPIPWPNFGLHVYSPMLFKTINWVSDAAALQNVVSHSRESSSSDNLELNDTKCKVLRVTQKHRKIIYPYYLRQHGYLL